jgi:chemotaxis protein methyltransferase CheR
MSALLSTPPESSPDAEFAFGAAEFERIRQLIHQRAGISLHEGKQVMVYSRLSRRLRELRQPSFASYLQWLESTTGDLAAREWQAFVNCLTTNLTAFFREEHHFPLLAAELQRRRGRVRIWCNAASTGEEPYSLAMTVIDTLGPKADVEIFCSDIDTNVLASAARGVYAADSRGLGSGQRKHHFLRGTGANAGLMRVKPELQRLLRFAPFNLMTPRWSLGEPFDIVFCRNVMIYFDAPTQRTVLERMHGVMAPRALLFAGHSENFADSRDLFRLRGKTVYEKV